MGWFVIVKKTTTFLLGVAILYKLLLSMGTPRGLSYKKVCFKRPKVLVIVRVWDILQQCETSQTLNLCFKRPKLWEVWNIFFIGETSAQTYEKVFQMWREPLHYASKVQGKLGNHLIFSCEKQNILFYNFKLASHVQMMSQTQTSPKSSLASHHNNR